MTKVSEAEKIAGLRINLEEIEPVIWRQVEVPTTATLKTMHDVIQAAFGWKSYHLHLFEVGEERCGVPDPEWGGLRPIRPEKAMRLSKLIERGVGSFGYTYDFGDNWRHRISVGAIGLADPALEIHASSRARDAPHLRMSAACRATRNSCRRSPARATGSTRP